MRGRIESFEDGYPSERGGTEQFVSAELRYGFFPGKRVSPYVLGGTGRGISRPNVNDFFPDKKKRGIQVLYYGGGVRIPVRPRLDVRRCAGHRGRRSQVRLFRRPFPPCVPGSPGASERLRRMGACSLPGTGWGGARMKGSLRESRQNRPRGRSRCCARSPKSRF